MYATYLRFCCGGKTRTYDLWVMSPTSYQLLHSAMFLNSGAKVRPLFGKSKYSFHFFSFSVHKNVVDML